MEKYLSIPVTGAGNQLVSCIGVLSVYSATDNATTVVITYKSGTVSTITTTQTYYAMRNQIQNAMTIALATGWTNVSREVSPINAVTAIVAT